MRMRLAGFPLGFKVRRSAMPAMPQQAGAPAAPGRLLLRASIEHRMLRPIRSARLYGPGVTPPTRASGPREAFARIRAGRLAARPLGARYFGALPLTVRP